MKKLKKIFQVALGFTFIIIGLAGLVLPILSGAIFLLLGFILLSFQSPYVEHHLSRIAHKSTTLGSWYEKLNTIMRKIFSN